MNRQILEYEPVIGFRFVPGLQVRVPHEAGGYLVKTNAQGFRCAHDFDPAPDAAGRRRVLLFGDSFTAGDGVSNGQRYGDQLESLLGNVQVYNYGLPGSGTDQQYLAWRGYGRGVSHELLIIAAQVENIRRVAAQYRVGIDPAGRTLCYPKPYFTLESGGLELHHQPVPREPVADEALQDGAKVDRGGRFATLRKLVNAVGAKEFVQRVTGYQPLPEYNQADNPDWLLMKAVLTRWVQEHRGPVLLTPLPLHHYVEGTADASGYQARFRELAGALGCHFHDPLPDLLAYSAEARRGFRFEGDIHPTPAGHRALAESLRRAVAPLLATSEAAS